MALSGKTSLTHSVDEVLSALTNEDFQRSAASDLGGRLITHTVQGEVTGPFTLTVERSAPTDRLPDMVSKLIGDSLSFTQVDEFSAPAADGSRTAVTKISVKGAPISVSGQQTLRPAGQGSELELTGDISSSIPFVGGKLAKVAEPLIGKVLARQARSLDAWLDAR
ncbi:DUF2505 domain-containing protein [Falsarthrobacter nasiphocae]|uniref:DUF2505 domain-containing protein n=1 Tax=Falsarthrobacter nasiphocae TaxID=189863 RepID=A0AAE3YGH4_9MICC|nr:DUF2505 domain-containing protein [Falsarthrobacter nasiphocae]MDR6891581.1 hypothetical protein [Falsarthrobacter nasiphocae]